MKINEFEKLIFSKLHSKYKIDNTIYSLNLIDNIIFNERSHLVSKFKDHLILDDEFEFLKSYYNYEESNIRLKAFLDYYSQNKRQYPNYSNLKEAKFIIKNIFNKQEMIENLENSIQKRQKEKNKAYSIENLSNTVFNSKVYDSIINDSGNCLSIFSYDKESLNSVFFNSRKKKEDDINRLINHFEEAEPDITFSFRNKKDKITNMDNSLIKDLNLYLENNNDSNKNMELQKNQNIYKKKKTANNSINKRKNIICNSTRTQKNFDVDKNENIDYINYKNLVLYSENNHNQMKIFSKKIDLNSSPFQKIKANNSSMPYMALSKDNSNKKVKNKNNIKNKKVYLNESESKAKQKNKAVKINVARIKDSLQIENLPRMIKVKINMKKNDNNKINIDKQKSNNNAIKNQEKQNITIDKKLSYLKKKAKIDNKNVLYNNSIKISKNYETNNKLINDDNINRDLYIKNLEKFDTYRSHSNNMLKDNKINLIKNNLDYNIHTDYLIDKYNNKSSNYNNYTSIQFNNNNINIINSNSNNINNNMNHIYYNTIVNNPQKSDDINLFNNLSKIGTNKSLEFKNKRKKLNKKSATYFISNNNSEKLENKFKFKKKLRILDNMSIINNNINTEANSNRMNTLSQHHRQLESERISTPFNPKQNKKIFFKIYKKVNLSNNKDQKNRTIMNDAYKRYQKIFLNKKIIQEMNNSNNIDNFDKFNFTQMGTFNKTKKRMNSFNFNNSNFFNSNASLYMNKKNTNQSKVTYYKNIDKNDLFKNNLGMNISNIYRDVQGDKKGTNNLGKILKRKKVNKDNELLEIKKLDERKKMIINQFNAQMNQIKLKFIKEIENKFEISKRNIINKRKNKNKLNVNTNFAKYK